MIDAWGSHPYPLGPFTQPPQAQLFQIDLLNGAQNPNHQPPPPELYNRGVRGYQWELWKLSVNGVNVEDLPVIITETGWRHAESQLPDALDNSPGDLPTANEMQQYVNDMLYEPELGLMHDEGVRGVVFFALNGDPAEWGHTNWLLINSDGEIVGPPYVSLP